jgi:hypothetical protein
VATAHPILSRLLKETYIAGTTIVAIALHLVLRYGIHAPLRIVVMVPVPPSVRRRDSQTRGPESFIVRSSAVHDSRISD